MLHEAELLSDPIRQFAHWFHDAIEAKIPLAEGMTLATVDGEGRPSARVVLLKDFDERGFTFYTNYQSRKAIELDGNPHAALCFWWGPLERQVRIEGEVERVAEEESDAYFATRPRGSQIGAWASPQSSPIESRQALEAAAFALIEKYAGKDVPRPPHWGGYRLHPRALEFWQNRDDRLHDRFRYERTADGWTITRLGP
jgi:pyridoxamine 5'-phosphate oxidase